MEEELGQELSENYIMKMTDLIYGLLQSSQSWFKEYINTMILKAGFNKCKLDPFLLYIVNKIENIIVTIYMY